MTQSEPASKATAASKPSRRTRVVLVVALGVLSIACVGLAWRMAGLFGRTLHHAPPAPPAVLAEEPTSEPAATVAAGSVAADVLGLMGLGKFHEEPAGVPPPPGSRRTGGLQRLLADSLEQHASYEVTASLDSVAEHYRQTLKEMGFQLLGGGLADGPSRTMIFVAGSTHITIALRTNAQDARIVELSVTAILPAPPAEPDEPEKGEHG